MRTPRNDVLDCDGTDDAREFVCVVRVPEIAQSLNRWYRWDDWWWYNARVRAIRVVVDSGTVYGGKCERRETRLKTRERAVVAVDRIKKHG